MDTPHLYWPLAPFKYAEYQSTYSVARAMAFPGQANVKFATIRSTAYCIVYEGDEISNVLY
jgi:hypothetical protein